MGLFILLMVWKSQRPKIVKNWMYIINKKEGKVKILDRKSFYSFELILIDKPTACQIDENRI